MISIAREARGRDSSNEPFAQQPVTVPFSCPSLRLRDPVALASDRERAGAIKASKDTKTSAEKFDVGRKKKKNDERDSICSAKHLRLRWFFVASPPCPLPSDPLSLFHRHALCDPLSALIEREMPKTRKNPNISSLSLTIIDTSETCDESMAWRPKPVAEQSKLASVTSSLTASRSFLSRAPCSSRASNMVEKEGFCEKSEGARRTNEKKAAERVVR